MARLRGLYQAFGKPKLVDEYISHGGHADRPDLRVAAFKWMNRHLKKDDGPVTGVEFKQISGKDLRVFAEDSDIPKDAVNGRVDQMFVPVAQVELPAASQFGPWKAGLLSRLRDAVFRAFPQRIPAPKSEAFQGEVGGNRWFSGNLTTAEQIAVGATIYLAPEVTWPGEVGTLIVLGDDEETENAKFRRWVIDHFAPKIWCEIAPRGVRRSMPWTHKSPPNYVERAHALLGWTVDEGRVWDVAATAHYLHENNKYKNPLRVVGRGPASVIAAYAALLEPSIGEVVLFDPPASHREGPIFLNVLRVLDIPEALGLLAPNTALTLVRARDKAFDRSAELYQRAGAAAKFRRVD
jgi:hypothetical protein